VLSSTIRDRPNSR